MKKETALVLLIFLAFSLFVPRPACAEPWTMKEFMISVWGGPANEEMAAAYRDAHFNTVMAASGGVDLCAKYGLKVIVMNATPEIAAANKDNPNVWGWFVRDEPKEAEYAATAVPTAALHAADPNHPAYVNMVSTFPLDSFFETVNPRIMSFDYYQWWWGTYMQFYFLDIHRRMAEKQQVPLLVWVEVNADKLWEYGKPGAGYPADNEAKIRQSVYTALAYGAKGIQWFVESLLFKLAPDGKAAGPVLTRAGEDVKKINAELEALGPELIGLKSTGVFHTPPFVYEKEPLPLKDRWVKVKGREITVGLFEDAAGARYMMAVNRDIANRSKVVLKPDVVITGILRFDRVKRKWVPESSNGIAALEIAPGDGELLKIEK